MNTILTDAMNSHPFPTIFKDKGMFTVSPHDWYPFSSLLKDISYHKRQLNVYGNAPGAPVTHRWRLKMEKYENVCEGNAQSTLKDENCP